jgi:ABC-type uncharacterized transport system permease subunit
MSVGDRIVRGILIGGAIGAFSTIFGLTGNMFVSVGLGAIAGCLAGITHAVLDKKRKQ